MGYIMRLYNKSPTTEWASENQQIRYIEWGQYLLVKSMWKLILAQCQTWIGRLFPSGCWVYNGCTHVIEAHYVIEWVHFIMVLETTKAVPWNIIKRVYGAISCTAMVCCVSYHKHHYIQQKITAKKSNPLISHDVDEFISLNKSCICAH